MKRSRANCLRTVLTVAGLLARGVGDQTFALIEPNRFDSYAGEPGHFPDGQRFGGLRGRGAGRLGLAAEGLRAQTVRVLRVGA
jgi:hypothetical protein